MAAIQKRNVTFSVTSPLGSSIKISRDVAAGGAVLRSAIGAVVIGLIVFLPYVLSYL